MNGLLRQHEQLARLLFEETEAGHCEMGTRLFEDCRPLELWSGRFKPASHFMAGAIEYKKAIGRCAEVLASHLGKAPWPHPMSAPRPPRVSCSTTPSSAGNQEPSRLAL
jgi:hypothetical protein